MIVRSCNEWDQLKTVIVGTAKNAHFPTKDETYYTSMLAGAWKETPPPTGPAIEQVIEETEEDLAFLCDTLTSLDIEVLRPDDVDLTTTVKTTDWETDGQYSYCPRDTLLVIDDVVIETPMTSRARQHEAIVFDSIRRKAIAAGAKWFSAPRPRLLADENIFDGQFILNELEPAFDAANVCRINNNLLYLVSSSGNRLGAKWLQNVLGSQYNVQTVDMYNSSHIDSTIVPIAEGTVVLNGSRVNEENVPAIFKDWDKIYINETQHRDFTGYPYASNWIGINMLAVDPQTVIVDEVQTNLIDVLEKKNFTVIPLPLRHSRTLGGGFHCVTLDLWRDDV